MFLEGVTKSDIFGSSYKIIRDNKSINKILDCIRKNDGTYTSDYFESRKVILDYNFGNCDDDYYIFEKSNCDYEYDSLITIAELNTVIKELQIKKAAGIDGLSGEIIKTFCNSNLNMILKIYNLIWDNGNYPEAWKVAKVILIPKERKIYNYRLQIDQFVYYLYGRNC